MLTEKFVDSEWVFRKDGWRLAPDADLRRQYLVHLAEKITRFRRHFNDGSKAFVVPVVKGISEENAHRVITGGFESIATEEGFFGKGLYFTSRLEYSASFAQDTSLGKAFLVSLTVPGNSFPTSEPPFVTKDPTNPESGKIKNPQGSLGRPCYLGYQSNYVEVDHDGYPVTPEGMGSRNPATDVFADELVVFDSAQVLPLFLVYSSQFTLSATISPESAAGSFFVCFVDLHLFFFFFSSD